MNDFYWMKKITCFVLFLFSFFGGSSLPAFCITTGCTPEDSSMHPDSLRERQFLYNGVLWNNQHKRIAGDPFLFSNFFLPGEVSFNGKKFTDLKIRYDIYSDEVMIPRDMEQIIRLNSEMVDSFSIVYNDRIYRFKNIGADTSPGLKGYINVLYSGRSALFVKYTKKIFTEVTNQTDGEFYQVHSIHLLSDGKMYELSKLKDILSISGDQSKMIREYVKENKIRVNRKSPGSFVPLVKFYDSVRE